MKTTFLPWIEKHWDKLDWDYLSLNINAISMLEKEEKKLSSNQLIK